MAHDRMSGNQLPLTHEYLARMLGTRRATVTTLIPELEGFGAIRNGRGRIMVLDRAKTRTGGWRILWYARLSANTRAC
jgi:CRP-like cAMP-binding protein